MSGMCDDVLEGANVIAYPSFLKFAREFLASYKERDVKAIPYWPEFADWTLAGKMFGEQMWKH
jgi:hypothetical protein